MGTPIADMLAHSPPLPLVIDYHQKVSAAANVTAEDEEGALLAFKQRDRVLRVRLAMPVTNLQKVVAAMGNIRFWSTWLFGICLRSIVQS